MGLILDISPRTLERVLYFASYIVLDKGETDLSYKQILSEAEYQEAKEKWGKMIERYLKNSAMLKMVFLLIDIRHEPSANDRMMYEWIIYNGYHPVVIATKLDKINRSQVQKHVKMIREGLGMEKDGIIIPFSAETKQGRDEIWDLIEGNM